MRLTLRTLMAYRDGVLSTEETSNLHKRIKQSEVAGNLLRRIELVVQRTQISAPAVDATGLEGDPNTVAEYLDDALPGEKVPEFERICIAESDVQLAELAHCHQLLADAMHSQVRVPQQLKSLIMGLGNPENRQRLEQRLLRNASTVEAVVVTEPENQAIPQPDSSHRHSTPSIDNSKNRNFRDAEQDHRRLDSAHRSPTNAPPQETTAERPQVQAPMVTSGGGSIKPRGLDLEGSHLAHEIPEYLVGSGRDVWRMPLAIGAMIALLVLLGWLALGPIENVKQLFDSRNSFASLNDSAAKNIINVPLASDTLPKKQSTAKLNPAQPDQTQSNPAQHGDSDNLKVGDANAADRASSSTVTTPIEEQNPRTVEQPPAPVKTSEPPKTPPAPTPLPTVDTPSTVPQTSIVWSPNGVIEQDAVLFARRIAADGKFSLIRLAPRVPIAEGAEIVVPPAMRATLDLAGNCQWTICGATQLQIPKLADAAAYTIATPLCRALVKPGTQGNSLSIVTPAGSANLIFKDATGMAAVEVAYRPVASGVVTDSRAYKPLLIVVAVAGQVLIELADQAKLQTLNLGDGLALIETTPRLFKLGEIPAWYRGSSERPLDEQAALDFSKLLPVETEIGESLVSICSHRRPETAALAIQTSMLLGDWQAFANGFLGNEAMRNHWASTIALAEQLIASDAGNAKSLLLSLESADPVRGKKLFDLIEGFPEDQQPSDFLPQLIDLLDSSQLDERVLAANHLRRMTGKDFGYLPHLPNRTSVQQWRREFAANRLKINNVGDPLWESKK